MKPAVNNHYQPSEISSLVIPMSGINMLLPSEAVVEILTETIVPKSRVPSWFLGFLDWRSQPLPVVSMELMLDSQESALDLEKSRVAIVNTVCGNPKLPFYGIQVYGIPRLTRINIKDVKLASTKIGLNELLRVFMGSENLCIPDLKYVEASILKSI